MAGDVRLIRSPLSAAGMVLTTISAVLFLVVFLADVLGLHTNPYLGIVFFLVLPGLFMIGLLLIQSPPGSNSGGAPAGKHLRRFVGHRSISTIPLSGPPPSSSSD
jgi:uncharacterized RDD family membrane protein YckC